MKRAFTLISASLALAVACLWTTSASAAGWGGGYGVPAKVPGSGGGYGGGNGPGNGTGGGKYGNHKPTGGYNTGKPSGGYGGYGKGGYTPSNYNPGPFYQPTSNYPADHCYPKQYPPYIPTVPYFPPCDYGHCQPTPSYPPVQYPPVQYPPVDYPPQTENYPPAQYPPSGTDGWESGSGEWGGYGGSNSFAAKKNVTTTIKAKK